MGRSGRRSLPTNGGNLDRRHGAVCLRKCLVINGTGIEFSEKWRKLVQKWFPRSETEAHGQWKKLMLPSCLVNSFWTDAKVALRFITVLEIIWPAPETTRHGKTSPVVG